MTAARELLVVVASDLLARARIESVAAAAGLEVIAATSERSASTGGRRPVAAVVDLDEVGPAVGAVVEDLRRLGLAAQDIFGYYSHVDADTGRRASAAGCRVFPRGRFWAQLPQLLAAPGDPLGRL